VRGARCEEEEFYFAEEGRDLDCRYREGDHPEKDWADRCASVESSINSCFGFAHCFLAFWFSSSNSVALIFACCHLLIA